MADCHPILVGRSTELAKEVWTVAKEKHYVQQPRFFNCHFVG